MKNPIIALLLISGLILSCEAPKEEITGAKDPNLNYAEYSPGESDQIISRSEYADKLYGFWLAQCAANWTGLVTEMDKIGGDGINGRGAGFYTREAWGGPDGPAIWEETAQDRTIDFVLTKGNEPWGADDDTDVEYIYQWLMYTNQTTQLTGEQIRDGWMKHIYSDENTPFRVAGTDVPENYLWVSNQTAHDLMREQNMVPPATSDPENNKDYEMIDAQLTTEIFGFFAPTKPELAREIAELPIRTTARENAEWAAQYYVTMYSLASSVDQSQPMKDQVMWLAEEGRKTLPAESVVASMYDFVKKSYEDGVKWETTRDSLHIKYQINQEAGYDWYEKDPTCHGCFAGGINFGASLVSLFYGEGDLVETIKIGVLAGWDSDNPTATWGGLLGFMIGKEGVEKAFGTDLSETFNIHRTRGGFPNDGIDTFENMAQTGVFIVDRMVQERMGGGVDLAKDIWYIPTN